MQRSIILRTATRYLLPLLVIFSVFLLIRGHNEIGGGFTAGLVAAAALMLYAIAVSPRVLDEALPIRPRVLIAAGLLTSAASAVLPMLLGKPFFTGLWLKQEIAVIGKVGTPLLFDIGVYGVVIGIVLWMMLTLAEEDEP